MTAELLIVASIVLAALGYLVRKVILPRKRGCDKCSLHQALEDPPRKAGGASPSPGSTR